jgi:hypothetical protein
MSDQVKLAFDRQIVILPLGAILPLRKIPDEVKKAAKYKRILKSIPAVGIVEPLVVARPRDETGAHLLLDGHLRHAALLELGETMVRCLVADDDEALTYNKRVNRLATVQEHYMIVRALERGVSEEKLAAALDMDIKQIKRRRSLLNGICPEVIDLLKDKTINPVTFEVLRKMKPMRQIEAAELMTSAGTYSSSYAKALLAATRQNDLVHADKPKKVGGMSAEQMSRMEREMETLQRDLKTVETSYGDDVLHLVIASGYLSKLVNNTEIRRHLEQRHPEFLEEFTSIIAAASLDQTSVAA